MAKKAINDKAKEITDPTVLQELKDKELTEAEAKKKKEENKLERRRKAEERKAGKQRKKLEQEKKALEKAKEKEKRAKEKRAKKQRKPRSTRRATSPTCTTVGLDSLFSQLDIEDNGQCSSCGMFFSNEQDEDKFWVCCDKCDMWYCFACHNFPTKDTVTDEFCCLKCM